MDSDTLIALVSLFGNLLGSVGAIFVSNKLLNYRVDKLEERVATNEKMEPRLYDMETHNAVQDHKLQTLESEVNKLRAGA